MLYATFFYDDTMMEQNKKYIALISFLRKFIKVFFTLFFNIYILKIVNNDLLFVIKYSLFGVIIELLICYILCKLINSKNAKIIYKLSFPLLILLILLLIVFKENIVKYILAFKALEILMEVCYSLPYELIVIGSNDNKTMSSYVASINILSSLATILTPIFSGFVIQTFSYNVLFIILCFEALLIILISFKIKDFTVNDRKLELKKFFNLTRKRNEMKAVYKCMFYRRISTQGVITILLPIILFLRLGKELSLGAYNTLFAILSIISLEVLKIANKKNIKKTFYPYIAIIIFIASIIMIFKASLTTMLIYYITMNTLGAIIESESCSAVYSVVKFDNLYKYSKEHILMYNIYMTVGQLVSYGIVFVLYRYFYSVNILSISVSILMFFLIISCVYLNKTQGYLYNKSNVEK